MRARAAADGQRLMRAALALLALLALAAACRGPAAVARPVPLKIGPGLSVPRAPLLIDLPQSQRFRVVAPDRIVDGLRTADLESAKLPRIAQYRDNVSTVLLSHDWVEVVDSADYEFTVFLVSRSATRVEVRTEPVVSARPRLPPCDATRPGQRPGTNCSDRPEPVRTVRTTIPYTEHVLYHVLRRRSDGAVKWWSADNAIVALDLLRMLLATDGA
jgi:hypothetical protein